MRGRERVKGYARNDGHSESCTPLLVGGIRVFIAVDKVRVSVYYGLLKERERRRRGRE
jgi:hypothetical protein